MDMTYAEMVREKMQSLSVGQKQTAIYLVNHLEEASYATLAELSRAISVSETTIIRLALSLGFESFSKMQKKIREEILGASVEMQEAEEGDFCKALINKEIECLEKLGGQMIEGKAEQAAEHLWNAKLVLLVGARGALGPVTWFAEVCSHLRGNVFLAKPYTEEGLARMADMGEDTVMFCVSLSRYAKGSMMAAQAAKKRGAYLIAITDSPVSPIALIADEFFVVEPLKSELGFNSFVSVLCIENILVSAIRKLHGAELKERIQKYEGLYAEADIFYE